MEVEKLNDERKRQGLSVAELAKKANLPQGTVEKVLFGIVKNPRIDTMQAIERALGLSEWSAEEKAEGVGNHPTYLNEGETEWIELRSEILRVFGQDYLDALTSSLQKLTEISDKK